MVLSPADGSLTIVAILYTLSIVFRSRTRFRATGREFLIALVAFAVLAVIVPLSVQNA